MYANHKDKKNCDQKFTIDQNNQEFNCNKSYS